MRSLKKTTQEENKKEENSSGKKNYTYILRCGDGSLYTGWTTDIDKRLKEHRTGKGAKYTRGRGPLTLVHLEVFDTKSGAMKREAYIKGLTRIQKEELIAAVTARGEEHVVEGTGMKLSLMVINLLTSIFMDEQFAPKENPDVVAYENVLKLAHDAGYKAVDLTAMESAAFGADRVKMLLEKYDLRCGSMVCFNHYTCTRREEQKTVQAQTRQVIDDAAAIGCKTVMLAAAMAQPDTSREDLLRGLAGNLSDAAVYAKGKGIQICVEDFPSLKVPMCAADEVAYLLDHVDGLKLTYDTANMLVEGEDPDEYYDRFKNRIGYCHLKDVRLTEGADSAVFGDRMRDGRKMITTYHGKGVVDLKTVIRRLREDGYQGYLSAEYARDGEEENLLEILTGERKYLEELMENGKQGNTD